MSETKMDQLDIDTLVDEENMEEDLIIGQTLSLEELAEEKKTEGNIFYVKKDYQNAIKLYTEAIELNEKAAYYGNRGASYMMLNKINLALDDARRSTVLDPDFIKGFYREAKCQLLLGEVVTAVHLYQKVIKNEPNNETAKLEFQQAKLLQQFFQKAEENISKSEFRTAIYNLDRCIEIGTECTKFKVLKAECLSNLQRYQEAQDIASDVLRQDGCNADAIFVRGLCFYYMDNSEKAFQHFQQVLKMAPDHEKAKTIYRKAKNLIQKKEEGNNAFKKGNWKLAYDLYTEALEIDFNNVFTNSKLYFNRATVSSKMSNTQDALNDCTMALNLDSNYLKAYFRRAKCYMEAEQYEEAVRDYEKIYKLEKTPANKHLLHEAKLELKKSKRKDYYKVLALKKNATDDDIKKAYKKHALLHHPDRHSHATDEVKKNEEKKFKEIGEAYAILSDPKKKARYDNGQDLDDDGMAGFHGANVDPNLIFQSFFGSQGGHPFQSSFGGNTSGFTFSFG